MKVFSRVLAMSLAVAAFSVIGVSAQGYSADVTNIALQRSVEKEILMLPYYEVFDHISYKVEGSTVILSGKVYNGSNKKAAESAVRDLKGVANVVNNIELLPVGGFDDSIRRTLYRNMNNMAGLSRYFHPVNPDIRLIVENGRVTLEGYVANRTDVNLANIVANGVPGVFSVTNNLVVDSKRAG